MKLYKHQEDLIVKSLKILQEHMLVYIACEERTGKTLVGIEIAERIKKVKSVLVITKKKALDGWHETLSQYRTQTKFTVVNYHQAHKIDCTNISLVILDESHNYVSSFPKPSKMWQGIKKICSGKPIIYMSATPFAQGYQLLYHQFKLSDWSPWREWKNSYDWFAQFGIPEMIWIGGRQIIKYTSAKESAFDMVKHLFVTMTRQEIGFKHEPISKVHYIELGEKTKLVYNTIVKDRAVELNGWMLVCDSIGKLRTTLHMLEGGVALVLTTVKGKKKPKRNYIQLGNTEKIQYILNTWGDTEDLVIMYYFIAEEEKLKNVFKKATILQASTFAEGVDLSAYKHLVIYSQEYSTAKHTQRRARQANMLREDPIVVHYLLVEDAISTEAYNAVAINKRNYVDSLYNGKLLK